MIHTVDPQTGFSGVDCSQEPSLPDDIYFLLYIYIPFIMMYYIFIIIYNDSYR